MWASSLPLLTLILLRLPKTRSPAESPFLWFWGMMGGWVEWTASPCEQSWWASCHPRTSTHAHAHPAHPRGAVCVSVLGFTAAGARRLLGEVLGLI